MINHISFKITLVPEAPKEQRGENNGKVNEILQISLSYLNFACDRLFVKIFQTVLGKLIIANYSMPSKVLKVHLQVVINKLYMLTAQTGLTYFKTEHLTSMICRSEICNRFDGSLFSLSCHYFALPFSKSFWNQGNQDY
jgi:hypothetical protein